MAKPLETTVSDGWTALTADMFKADGKLAAVLSLILFENREEQELSGGRQDQSRFKSSLMNRASSQNNSAPTTFVIDLFSTGTDF